MSKENKTKDILGNSELKPMVNISAPARLYLSGKTAHRILLIAKGLPVPDMPCTDAEINISRIEQFDPCMDTDVQHAYLTPILPLERDIQKAGRIKARDDGKCTQCHCQANADKSVPSSLTSHCRTIQQTDRMSEGGLRRGEVDILIASTPASKSSLQDVVLKHMKSRRKNRE